MRNKRDYLYPVAPSYDPQLNYLVIENRLAAAAASLFGVENAPKTFNVPFFENKLLRNSKCSAIVPNGGSDIFAMPYIAIGPFRNVYGFPVGIVGLAPQMLIPQVKTKEFEICYDNVLQYDTSDALSPTWDTITDWAQLIWITLQTYRSNILHQNKPFMLPNDTKTKLSFANFWEFFQDYRPYIMYDKGSKIEEDIKTLDLKVDFLGREILACYTTLWNAAMSAIGFAAGTTKEERQLVNEVALNANTEGSVATSRWIPREDFWNRVNNHWGLDCQPFVRNTPLIDKFGRSTPPKEYGQQSEHEERDNV